VAQAWEPLMERLTTERYGRLLAHALVLVGDRAEAEDLVQDALIATFGKRRGFESVAQAEQYVRRAIVSRFVDGVRRSSRERALWGRAADAASSVPDHGAAVSGALDVGVALRTLPPRVRACVALRYLEDMSIPQTAELLRLSDGAVKRYVWDGLKALNALLGTREALVDSEFLPVEAGRGGAA